MPAGQLFNTPTKYRPRAFGITLRPHIMGSGSQGKSTALTKYRFPMAAGNPPMKRMLIHRGNVHLWAGGALAATAAIGAGAYAIHRHNRPKPRIAIKSTHHRKVKRGPKGRFAGSY